MATSTPKVATSTPPGVPVYFPLAQGGYIYDQGVEIATTTLPEAAGGAGGFTYGLTPALPAGLSFDAATRVMSGTPTEAGEHTMTYTATDEGGREASFDFTISVEAAPQTARQTDPRQIDASTVARTQFSEPTAPALDVSWTGPSDGTTVEGYEAQYRKQGETNWTSYTGTLTANTTSLNLPNLEPGATYEVQVRAVTSEEGDGPWSDTREGTTNRPPPATGADDGLHSDHQRRRRRERGGDCDIHGDGRQLRAGNHEPGESEVRAG